MGETTKERPILFSAPMVRAILDGKKTQTRRVVKGLPAVSLAGDVAPVTDGKRWAISRSRLDHRGGAAWPADPKPGLLCPYGKPGDRLWVKETHAFIEGGEYDPLNGDYHDIYSVGGPVKPHEYALAYRADDAWQDTCNSEGITWRPSIFMPRWASRITLEVTGVRVERLQDISGEDAVSEGISIPRCTCEVCVRSSTMCTADASAAAMEYRTLWESIHGPGAWDANPWVWVVSFKRAEEAA